MSATASSMMPLGTTAPDFNLINPHSNHFQSLTELKGETGTLIIFMCNHCPYVLHIKQQMIDIALHYKQHGIQTIAISANDVTQYPQDAPNKMIELMAQWNHPFNAYLYDKSQAVAKAYQATCTPDFYLFDEKLQCVYRGRLDASTPKNNIPLTGEDLRMACEHLCAKTLNNNPQISSIGCNIKWK